MKTYNKKKQVLALIIALFLLLGTISLPIVRTKLLKNNRNIALNDFEDFVEDLNLTVSVRYFDIFNNNYDFNKLEEIAFDDKIKSDFSNSRMFFIAPVNEILKNSPDNTLRIVYVYDDKIYFESLNGLYHENEYKYYIISNKKECFYSIGGNRLISDSIDLNLIQNDSTDINILRFSKEKYLIYKYNKFLNIYTAQISTIKNFKAIERMKYASILFLMLLVFELSYLLIKYKIYKNQKVSSIEQLIDSYNNIYYVVTNAKLNIIKYNAAFNCLIKDRKIFNLRSILKNIDDYNQYTFEINDKLYRFKKIDFDNLWYFISEINTEIKLEENKLLYNSHTQIPNINFLYDYLKKNQNIQNDFLIVLTVKNFNNFSRLKVPSFRKAFEIIEEYVSKTTLKYKNISLIQINKNTYSVLVRNHIVDRTIYNELEIEIKEIIDDILLKTNIKVELGVGVINFNHQEYKDEKFIKKAIKHLIEEVKVNDEIIFADETLIETIKNNDKIIKDIQKAIIKKEFTIYLQPIYNLVLNKPVKYEALLRWNHLKYINMSPLVYLKLAEEYGLNHDIGFIVIEEAVKVANKLKDENVMITINASVKEIDNQGFIKKLLSEIDKYNLDPSLIGIEITESSIIEAKPLTINNINLIKEKGIKIYLDDFGTGYSSLSNLREIPADYIKIDRTFIKNMDKSLVDERIVRSLIDLANSLNLEIIAEGVETREKVEKLEKMGCILLQGYYFSKPQPINKIIKG